MRVLVELFVLCVLLIVSPFVTRGQERAPGNAAPAPADQIPAPKGSTKKKGVEGELLLVRSWNQTSGELIAWMPTHSVEMTLKQIGPHDARFEPNEAVKAMLPRRERETKISGQEVRVAPDSVTFDGRHWLPVEREVNIVWIRKFAFYVKSIVFGNSKPRAPDVAAFQNPSK
ncbi:MAG: hypothetical protein ACE145_18520 [Terriglobia bacterium]